MRNNYHATTWFITGATGLLGSTIIEKLREADLAVIALVRKSSPKTIVNWLLELGVKIVEGDLLKPESYNKYIATSDIVVHTAAAVLVTDPSINHKINYEGTKLLLESMKEFGISRLIHISTVAVYGAPRKDPMSEDDLNLQPVGPYASSKLKAEKLILNDYNDISSTIIRPPYIFGNIARDRNLIPTLQNSFSRRIIPKAWRYNPEIGFVHAMDIASLVILAGSHSKTNSKFYNVESFRLKYTEIIDMIARTSEKRIYQIRIPFLIITFFAIITDIFTIIFRKTKLYAKKRSLYMKENWLVTTDLAKNDLGWSAMHIESNELELLLKDYFQRNIEDENFDMRDNF